MSPPKIVYVLAVFSAVDDEWYRRLTAESSSHWGALYSTILKLAFEQRRVGDMGVSPPPVPVSDHPKSRAALDSAAAKPAGGVDESKDGDEDDVSDSSDDEGDDASVTARPAPLARQHLFKRCRLFASSAETPLVPRLPFQNMVHERTSGRHVDVEAVTSVVSFDDARILFKRSQAHVAKALVRRTVYCACRCPPMPSTVVFCRCRSFSY